MLLLDEFDPDEEMPGVRDPADPFRRVMELVCVGHDRHLGLAIYWGNGGWSPKRSPETVGAETVVEIAIAHLRSAHDGVPDDVLDAVNMALGLGSATEALRTLVEQSRVHG